MKCEEAQELITALVDEELSHLERASIEAHPSPPWSMKSYLIWNEPL